MNKRVCYLGRMGAALVLTLCLCIPAFAAQMAWDEVYCFAPSDFSASALDGIVLTGVPDAQAGTVLLGQRVLRAGDVLAGDVLDRLTLVSGGEGGGEASLTYLPVTDRTVGTEEQMVVQIRSRRNDPPAARDMALETYRDIPITGCFDAQDPEGEALTYTIVNPPKRGGVEVREDGSFVYTPKENKVGKDSFTYTAADPAGNVSGEATVTVQIMKPSDRTTYADMADDPDQFVALWLREQEVFYGEQISSVTVFGPQTPVTRGEFLVMTMDALGIPADTQGLSTGFADEDATPAWMRPYLVSALRSGIITGVASEDGLVFRPEAQLTQAEAAVMLNNILHLDSPERTTAVFAPAEGETVPAWAAEAMYALDRYSLVSLSDPTGLVTRRETARMLYQAANLARGDAYAGSLLAWAAE